MASTSNSKSLPEWMKNDHDRRRAVNSHFPYKRTKTTHPSESTEDDDATIFQAAILNHKNWYQFFQRKVPPRGNDWLADKNPGVYDRMGQPFSNYADWNLRRPSNDCNKIGLQCIGNFNVKLNYFINDSQLDASNTKAESEEKNNMTIISSNKENEQTQHLKESEKKQIESKENIVDEAAKKESNKKTKNKKTKENKTTWKDRIFNRKNKS